MSMARPVRMASRSKYSAQPTVVDGIRFASKREAQRYGELKLLEKADQIRQLALQPRFALKVRANDAPVTEIIGDYVADFSYLTHDPDFPARFVVEDVKGVKTALYKWKKKHVEAQYGIQIREIK